MKIRIVPIALLFSCALVAQIRNSTIVGVALDPSGAPVPAAEITATELQTNQVYRATASASGDFSIPYLPIGKYVVSVRKEGFKTARTEEFELSGSQTLRVDLRLEVGTVETTVTVSGSAVELQTESSRIVNKVDETVIRNIPNINSNPLNYAMLQPGVVGRASTQDTQSANSFGIGVEGRRTLSNISVNGGTAFSNDIQIDGVTVQSVSWNEVAFLPNSEGIAEVKTNINNLSAEYGRSQGTIVFTTKSGTNEYHGSAQFRLRNEAFNANSFNNNAQGIRRPPFKVENYSFTFGGPVIIPKLYNGRDKTFFFASYEGLRFNQGVVYERQVPTALERRGDFSNTFANNSGVFANMQIFDPFNVARQPNGLFMRMPFPGAIIPPDRIAPGTRALINEYPLPNAPALDPTGARNFINTMVRNFSRDNFNSRVDHRIGSHSLYGTFGTNFGLIDSPNGWGAQSRGFTQQGGFIGRTVSDRNYYASFGDTWVISPTWVADMRMNVTRIAARNLGPVFPGLNYREFGIPSQFDPAIGVDGMMPELGGINFWSNLFNTAYLGKVENQTNWNFVGSVTKTRGRWTHKFGGEFRNALANYTDARGSFAINTSQFFTSGQQFGADGGTPTVVTPNLNGHGGAAALLGAGQIAAGENAVRLALAAPYAAVWTQNDWRVNNRLTVNLGLRWDWQPAPTERFNRVSSFTYGGQTFGSPGSLVFPGTNGIDRRLWRTEWTNFQPRLGAAYRLNDKTVIRAGFGINYLPTNGGYYGGPYYYGTLGFAPNTIALPYGANPQGALVGQYNQVTNYVPPLGANPNAAQYYGDGNNQPRFIWDEMRNGKALQWNFFVERRVSKDTIVSVGYNGMRAYNLQFGRVNTNSFQFQPDSVLQAWRQGYIANNGRDPGVDLVPNPFQPAQGPRLPFGTPFGAATVQRRLLANPWPLFTNNLMGAPIGWANYNALMVNVTKNLSNGLFLSANYTWSKAMSFGNTEVEINNYSENGGLFSGNIDRRNFRNTYSLSPNDIPHRFIMTMVYEMPFGKGRRFASGANGFVNALIGGWQVAPVVMIQAGQPQSVSGGPALNGQPNRVAGVPIELPANLQRWYDSPNAADRTVTLPSGRQVIVNRFTFLRYNPEAFAHPTVTFANGNVGQDIYYWGNAARYYDDFRAPGRYNVNLSLAKNFAIRERIEATLSAEATNLFNNTQWRPTALNGGTGAPIVSPNAARNERVGQLQNQNFGSLAMAFFDPRQVEFRLRVRF